MNCFHACRALSTLKHLGLKNNSHKSFTLNELSGDEWILAVDYLFAAEVQGASASNAERMGKLGRIFVGEFSLGI